MRSDGILLPPATMAAVDRAAIAAGRPGPWLMENAGRAVTRAVTARLPPRPVLVLCGPGNNGGDGWVVARQLRRAGWPVRVASLVPCQSLKGDAAWAAAAWDEPIEPVGPAGLDGADLVVDALFGAGLARPLDGAAAEVVRALNERRLPVVAVDVPSGVDGATGAVLGAAPAARLTVTFCRLKPGHLLLPGRLLCGETVLADIGIPDEVVAAHDSGLRANGPGLWRHLVPERTAESHKYRFGHALVVGGPKETTGATRLAARAALRVGAGLVSIACTPEALPVYAAQLTAVMTKPAADAAALGRLLADPRFSALLIGPGIGTGPATRELVATVLAAGRPTVLDADALTSFADCRQDLLGALRPDCVLTPHDGEFARLFDATGDRLGRALAASRASNAVVLLKGSDTVVAAPDGRATIQPSAPPDLATAGSGDVLAGLILGLLAQRVPAFEAASAAVWLHATAAEGSGPGLIAEDLSERVPAALAAMRSR
ncbi:NAD(P)H-hydrate dehydratase [Benzoatithermus flavus]|uniref:Bifunctional NAD(P)H-hydrate repair enzyme n=1 Tax=Benzoatithermus flavus TaxID=3108223 RepID=A0ABU8XMR1_9PROT